MPDFRLTLNAFGLGVLKPVVYRLFAGRQAKAGEVSAEYPDREGQVNNYLGSRGTDENRLSYLGTPVFCDIAIEREGKEDLILDTVLIDVSMRKNIVTTPIQGRNGTVKEYISDGDYEVKIRGAVTSADFAYPRVFVRDLHEILKQSELLNVVSDFLLLYDIKELVVTDYSFPQREGFQNMQLFEISCISDDSNFRLLLDEDA